MNHRRAFGNWQSATWRLRVFRTLLLHCTVILMPAVAFAQETSKAAGSANRPVAGYAMLMMILLLLIVVLVFGWFLMRSLQRSRQRLGRQRSQATDASDVWAMHKLPDAESDHIDDETDDGDDDDD